MNKKNENRFSMYSAVEQVCDENIDVWTEVAACSNAIGEFKSKKAEIGDARQIQENSHVGVTQDKHAKQQNMADIAMIVKGAVQAYATDTQNNALYESVDYSLSSIKQQSNSLSRDRALLIYNKAMGVSGLLGTYGIDTTMLNDFQTTIADYEQFMAKPRIAISTVKASSTQIDQLFAEADLILKRKMDKLLIQFKISNPAFYNTYLNARQIIDLGKGSKTLVVKLNANEAKTIQRVINGSTLTNTGTTVLRYCADQQTPCDATSTTAMLLQPGESTEVNIREMFVTLTNTDAAHKGSFKVKVTSTVPVSIPA